MGAVLLLVKLQLEVERPATLLEDVPLVFEAQCLMETQGGGIRDRVHFLLAPGNLSHICIDVTAACTYAYPHL